MRPSKWTLGHNLSSLHGKQETPHNPNGFGPFGVTGTKRYAHTFFIHTLKFFEDQTRRSMSLHTVRYSVANSHTVQRRVYLEQASLPMPLHPPTCRQMKTCPLLSSLTVLSSSTLIHTKGTQGEAMVRSSETGVREMVRANGSSGTGCKAAGGKERGGGGLR